jgi:hypothetical protein
MSDRMAPIAENNSEELLRRCPYNQAFVENALRSPDDRLVDKLLRSPKQFQRLINDGNFFYTAHRLSDSADKLFNYLFDNPKEFQRLIKTDASVRHITLNFPNQVERLAKHLQNNNALLQHLITITGTVTLTAIANKTPLLAEYLMNNILDNPEHCQGLITGTYDLQLLEKAFPQHAELFGKPTVAEAFTAIEERPRIALESQITQMQYTLAAAQTFFQHDTQTPIEKNTERLGNN